MRQRNSLTASNGVIVNSVSINGLVKGECNIVIRDGGIRGSIVHGDGRPGQTRNKFLNVTNAKGRGSRIARSVCIPEAYVCFKSESTRQAASLEVAYR